MIMIWGEWIVHGREITVPSGYRWNAMDYGWGIMEVKPMYMLDN